MQFAIFFFSAEHYQLKKKWFTNLHFISNSNILGMRGIKKFGNHCSINTICIILHSKQLLKRGLILVFKK